MDFVIIGNAWSAGRDNPTSKHQLALGLATRGHRVLWVDGTGMRTPRLSRGADGARILEKVRSAARGVTSAGERIFHIAPLILPMPSSRAIQRINSRLYLRAVKAACRETGLKDPVLINFLPVIPDIHRLWTGKSVYYCVDRWESFSGYDQAAMKEADEGCIRLADRVITTSLFLQDRAVKINSRSILVPHGVDIEHFRRALGTGTRPADIPDGRPVIGFVGLIGEWVDQDLLAGIARTCPEALVVLTGRADVGVDALRAEKNIIMTGQRPYSAIPGYMACFTVGIIPFKINDLTRAVNPLKLREMLAAGCPVVSTALPEVAALQTGLSADAAGRQPVSIAGNAGEFCDMVRKWTAGPASGADRARISDLMKNETWSSRVDRILEFIQ